MKCPYCQTETEAKSQTQRDIGKMIDIECKNGHIATVAWPDRMNEGVGEWDEK